MGKSSSRKILQGDRISHFGGGKGTITTINKGILKYEITWDNGKVENYTQKEFSKWCEVLPTESLCPIEEKWGKALSVEEMVIKARQLNLDFSREQQWKVGDRAIDSILGEVEILASNGKMVKVKTGCGCDPWLSLEGTKALQPCKTSEPADSLKESEDSPVQLSLLGDLTGEHQLSVTKTRSPSLNPTLTTESLPQTSETFIQTQANMIYSSVDSPAPTHQEPETELELLTYLQNLGQCSESSSDVSEKPDPSSCFWNSLRDLSIEDLEHGLEDCEWADIKASIRSSLDAINLKRSLDAEECLSFPTLLAGHGRKHRDAGLTECEKWWKQNVIREIGSQLSSEAIASLHGFPANWFRSISPPSVVPPVTQEDLQPESLEAKPSQSLKPELPSNGLNGYGNNLTIEEQLEPRDSNSIGKAFWCDTAEKLCTLTHLEIINLGGVLPDIRWAHVEWWWGWPKKSRISADELELVTKEQLVYELTCDSEAGRSPAKLPKSDSLGKLESHASKQTGSLYQYTANKTDKFGTIHTYPKVEGERRRDEDSHWYWGFSYVEKEQGKWRDKSAAIPRKKLGDVKQAIRNGKPYKYILQEILKK